MFYYFDRQNFRIVEATADEDHTFSEETTSPRGIEPKFFMKMVRFGTDGAGGASSF